MFTHPHTGRTATLVGTMHIGEPGYFRQLSAVVDRLRRGGAEIHVEGIGHHHGDRWTARERARLHEAEGWADPERTGAAVTLLRAQSQSVGLQLPANARNIDLSHVELLRRVGWGNYQRLFAPAPEGRAGAPGSLTRAALRFQLRHRRVLNRLKALRHRNRLVNRVVIEERNRTAFTAASDALHRSDVGLIWGADHLPGLAQLFKGAGYRLQWAGWFEACAL
jgi:hypothetical protein